MDQERERQLPSHEDDSDVANQSGGGILDEGGTAEVRGTGTRSGNAQGLDAEGGNPNAGSGMADDGMPSVRDVLGAFGSGGGDDRDAADPTTDPGDAPADVELGASDALRPDMHLGR